MVQFQRVLKILTVTGSTFEVVLVLFTAFGAQVDIPAGAATIYIFASSTDSKICEQTVNVKSLTLHKRSFHGNAARSCVPINVCISSGCLVAIILSLNFIRLLRVVITERRK